MYGKTVKYNVPIGQIVNCVLHRDVYMLLDDWFFT